MIKIAIINESTVVADADVQDFANAMQIQISRDFAPIWGVDAKVNFHPSKVAGLTDWQLVILDDSDQADALGYHELTAGGFPIGKVFAKSDLQDGASWTVTASHETLEMLGDPYINLSAQISDTQLYAYEVCDACEDDSFGYQIQLPPRLPATAGSLVLVSDFVVPDWFIPGAAGKNFDFQKKTTAPLQLLTNGYIGALDFTSPNGWTQINGNLRGSKAVSNRDASIVDMLDEAQRIGRVQWGRAIGNEGNRRERRTIPRSQWRRSAH